MGDTLFMENTEISSETTVAQITKLLMIKGASAILTEMENGSVEALSFRYRVAESMIPFRLPCRWKNIEMLLVKRANMDRWTPVKRREAVTLKAKRVAWRQIFRWVEAQLALVDTSMVKVEEVFFPYIQAPSGETIFEIQSHKGFLQLGDGK